MKNKILLSILLFIIFSNSFAQYKTVPKATKKYFSLPSNIRPNDYVANTIVVKVKPEFRDACSTNAIENEALNHFLNDISTTKLNKIFPHHQAPVRSYNAQGQKLADLSLIYQIEYSSDQISLEKVINKLYALNIFEFVEPKYIPTISFTPNDADIAQQWHLTNIAAYTGWDISKGDTNVVIGIVDTGTEPTHADLKENIKHNYADPINGIDDDNDGYIDNFSGWDLGESDNDPTWKLAGHGVHVCGLAAASTNNAIGIAGVAYKCKFLPVKISDASGALTMSYEGIVYAADHACAIINCSWGSNGGGQYGQTIIDYATINKDALVVAAAGNSHVETEFYPAAYNYVIAVANTSNDDTKYSSSNYGHWIDVSAPGANLYSTYVNGSYTTMSGTSMAAPCASGVAAMIKAYFPSYNAFQVGEQLKISCDDISSINTSYIGKLGTGRINLYKALTQTGSPSVVMTSRTVTDNNDDVFIAGDTLNVYGDFTNYLSPTSSALTATLSTTSSYVSILNNQINLGAINTLGQTNNNSNPFTIKIEPSAPQNEEVVFSIDYKDGAYSATEYFKVIINVDYINVTINDIATSITSMGRIGYNGIEQTEGLGFCYKGGESVLYEAGLMIGTSSTLVSDVVRNESSSTDEDFSSLTSVALVDSPNVSEFDLKGSFNDVKASTPITINVEHHAYAWSSPGNTKYVIVEYYITNGGSATLQNLYAGIFADWDIDANTYSANRAEYDAANRMGYAYYTGTNGTYVGIKLLSTTANTIHYAIDNSSGGNGGVDLFDGFSAADKYTVLSTNRTSAGTKGNGNDICDVVSSGPFTIGINDTAVVAFALLAGDSLSDLQSSALNAQLMYDSIQPKYSDISILAENNFFVQCFPNPFTNQLTILYAIQQSSTIEIDVYNALGERVQTYTCKIARAGMHNQVINVANLSPGIYYCQLKTNAGNSCIKVIKQ